MSNSFLFFGDRKFLVRVPPYDDGLTMTTATGITNKLNIANGGTRVLPSPPSPQIEHRYHPQVHRPSNQDTRQVLELPSPPQIQHRYHPHSGHHHHHHHGHDHHQHQHDHHPQESLLLSQFVEPPLQGVPIIVEPPPPAAHLVPVVEEHPPNHHYGYGYGTPSYVTPGPIYFTTAFPTKSVPPPAAVIEYPGVYTHYFLGNKLWYIPLYFGFAFVAFFGYIVVRDLVIRRFNLPPFARQLEGANEVLELTIRVLAHLQKAAEAYELEG